MRSDRRTVRLVLAALVTALALPTASRAAALVVDCDNTTADIAAVQSKVDAAADGDVIQIKGTCNFSNVVNAGGDETAIENAGVVIRPAAAGAIDGLTIESFGSPQSATIVGAHSGNAFFVAPGNANVVIRGLVFQHFGRPIVAVNAAGLTIGDGTNGTTPEARGNRIISDLGMRSAILAVGNDRGFEDPAGTLNLNYGGGGNKSTTFTIPAGQKLTNVSVVGNYITYAPPNPNDVTGVDVRQANAGTVESVTIARNAIGFIMTEFSSFNQNAIRVQAHNNDGAYHISGVDVIGNNFGRLEELPDPVANTTGGRIGILLARVKDFLIANNDLRVKISPVALKTPGGGIVTTDSSLGEIAHNEVAALTDPTTLSSDLGGIGVVDDLLSTVGGEGGGTASEDIEIHDNVIGPAVTDAAPYAQRGMVFNGSTNLTVRGNNVLHTVAHALEVAGKVEGFAGEIIRQVVASLFCGNLLDGVLDKVAEVAFQEDGALPPGVNSYANSLPNGTKIFGNGHCVSPAVTLTISGGDTTVSEAGATDTYDIRLTLRPSKDVTVTMNGAPQAFTTPASVTFTNKTWWIPQTITVHAIDDAVIEGTHSGTIKHIVSSADPVYNALPAASLPVVILDNDFAPPGTPGILLVESGGSTDVTEGGVTDSYTLQLTSQPKCYVQVNVFPDLDKTIKQSIVVPTSVTFGPSNWSVPQTIQVAAVDDLVFEGSHLGTIVHATTTKFTQTGQPFANCDPDYEAASVPGVLVHITDNDVPDTTPPAAPVITGCPGTITTKTLTVGGTAENGSLVTVYVNGSAAGTAFATPSWSVLITFSAAGTYFITATATDGSGNVSPVSAACTVVVNADFTPPSAPVILLPTEGSYNPPSLTISGTAEPGVRVQVSEGAINLGPSVTADAGGAWSVAVTLAQGAHAAVARATDSGGNLSPFSNTRSFFVDGTPPRVSISRTLFLPATLAFFGVSGTATDNLAVDRVELTYTNLLLGTTATVTATCTFGCGGPSITWEDTPPPGLYLLRAVAVDKAGLRSAPDTVITIVR